MYQHAVLRPVVRPGRVDANDPVARGGEGVEGVRQLDMVPGVEVYVDVAEALLENLVEDSELVPLDIDLEQRDLPAVLVPDPAQHSADRQEAHVARGLPELRAALQLQRVEGAAALRLEVPRVSV